MQKKLLAAALAGGLAITGAASSATAATKTTKKPVKATTKPTTAPTTASPTTAAPAATPTTAASAGKKGGTFTALNMAFGDPDHIDPSLAHTVEASQVTTQLYDGLVDIDYDTGGLKPDVADKWTVSADGKTVVFTLKKSTFSNGEAVLPSVIQSAQRMASKYILRTSGSSKDSSVWPRVE